MKEKAEPSMSGHHSVAVHYLRLLTDYVSSRNLSTEDLLPRAGIDAESLNDPNGRVPFVKFNRLCEIAAETLKDPCLGLKLGQNVRTGHLGSHGFALMSCSTGAELLQQHARYSALTIDAAHNAFEKRGDEYVRYWRSNLPGGAPLGRLQDELHQASWITLARWLANRDDLSPNWVSFRHGSPSDVRAYEDCFTARCVSALQTRPWASTPAT